MYCVGYISHVQQLQGRTLKIIKYNVLIPGRQEILKISICALQCDHSYSSHYKLSTKEANLEPEALNELLFADDQSLAHESEERLQEHTSSLNSICEEYDMKISINKTETMKVSRTPGTLNIKINDTNLKQSSNILAVYSQKMVELTGKLKTGYRRPTTSATSLPQY